METYLQESCASISLIQLALDWMCHDVRWDGVVRQRQLRDGSSTCLIPVGWMVSHGIFAAILATAHTAWLHPAVGSVSSIAGPSNRGPLGPCRTSLPTYTSQLPSKEIREIQIVESGRSQPLTGLVTSPTARVSPTVFSPSLHFCNESFMSGCKELEG